MKIKFYTLLLALIVWTNEIINAQNFTDMPAFKKANSWRMFKSMDGSGLSYIADFNTDPPVFYESPNPTTITYATAADSSTGELLFFTNSNTVWNRDFEVMPNGDSLSGDGYGLQGACIVAKINDPGKYYLFTIPNLAPAGSACDLRYSLIDMSLDSGRGDVVSGEKNIVLDDGRFGEMMIAIPGSQCDVWLLVHPHYEPVFKAYHITEDGIDPEPVLSYTDSTIYGPGAYISGNLAVSPDRSMIALTSNGEYECSGLGYYSSKAGGGLVAEFNPEIGTVFNDTKLTDSVVYGVAFSPDGSLLYMGDERTGDRRTSANANKGCVYQYDVSDFPAAAPLVHTDTITGDLVTDRIVYQFRMFPNGHLLGNNFLHYNYPDEIGTAAGKDTSRYSWLPDELTKSYALGNDLVFALPPDTTRRTTDTFFCKNGELNMDMAASGLAYIWDNGSTDSTRNITVPGKYWVSYLTDRCNVTIDTFIVAEYDPEVDLGDNFALCSGDPYTLVPSVKHEDMQFLWSDGSNGDSLLISGAGTYWVQSGIKGCIGSDTVEAVIFPDISDILGDDLPFCKDAPISLSLSVPPYPYADILWSTGATDNTININDTGTYTVSISIPPCNGKDSIRIYREICECYFDIPTAFSPNSDGLNDLFKITLEPGCPVQGYVLSIFNRYGQRVYIGWGPDEGWDGTYNGRTADAGVYMYHVRFFGGTRQIQYTRKGDITLIK